MGIPVRFEYSTITGWQFVTPWAMTSKAFQNACAKALTFYQGMYDDFLTKGRGEDARMIALAVEDLRRNRVRNIVDSTMIDEWGLVKQDQAWPDVGLPGVP